MIESIQSSLWINIIFFILAILGIFATLATFRRGKKEKIPCVNYDSYSLIGSDLKSVEGLSISFKGKPVENLSLTKVCFWNHGKDIIEGNDIAPSDTLKVAFDGNGEILDAEILYKSSSPNNPRIELSEDAKKVNFDFDYLAFSEGFIIQIYHTNEIDCKLSIDGTIKGVKKLLKPFSDQDTVTTAFDRKVSPDWLINLDTDKLHIKIILSLLSPILVPIVGIFKLLDFIFKFKNLPKEFDLGKS